MVRMAIASRQPASPSRPARGSYPIPLNAETTAGFLGRTERGPTDEPVTVENFSEYCRYFGGHLADGALSYAVHDFFLHGGHRAVVVRVTNRATRARIEIPTEDGVLSLAARYPGRHEILRVSIDYEQVENDDCAFNFVVQRLGVSGTSLVEDQELYPLISTRPSDMRFIGEVLEDSRLIALAGPPPATRPLATPPNRPGDPVRYIGLTALGDDGDELTDYDIIGSDRDGTGLFAFGRGPRIDLLSIPLSGQRELGSTAFVAAVRFCERLRAMLIWDPPRAWQSVDAAMLGSRQLDLRSGNVMTYFPRIRPRGARARFAGGMPASGAIAGMLAQRDRRGLFGLNEDADYSLRAALAPVVEVTPRDAQRLARYGVNSFVHATGGTMRLVGRVTLAAAGLTSSSSASLERRRLGFFILNSIEEAATAAAEDSDRDVALQRLEAQLTRFFDDLYLRRALAGRTPVQAYYLHAGSARNSGSNEPHRTIHLGFALNEPGRFVEYIVDLDGEQPGRLRRARTLEAQQLFS
jgi:hypothetical protein